MGQRVFITGCSGYLAQRLIEACRQVPRIEWLGGMDVRAPKETEGFHFFQMDVRSSGIASLLLEHRIDTIVHLAWVFNPTHEPELEYEVDVVGSKNVFEAAAKANIPYVIYLSSTTAYGPHADNPPLFDESYPRRGHPGYLYAKYKAEVDHIALEFRERYPEMRTFIIRACIVLGPNTRNVVTKMTEMPVMVGIQGYDPPMQFVHEQDIRRLLAWAVQKEPVGIFNVAGHGTILFSRLVNNLQRKAAWLPAWLVYPALGFLWKLRLLPFPPSILDFIRYPWVADTSAFDAVYDFAIQYSSEDALMAYAHARWPELRK